MVPYVWNYSPNNNHSGVGGSGDGRRGGDYDDNYVMLKEGMIFRVEHLITEGDQACHK